ncbi:MAG TPA: Uma2 family endonuclease [Candidatus Binatia bacterium]|nr:Uma2 family endonuclease [Candidatus Binatia bacterium]
MESAGTYLGHPPLIVHLEPVLDLSDDQFFEFCQINRDLRIERSAHGELIVMPPTGGATSELNAEITMQLRAWAKRDGSGATFDSSAGFLLPNRAVRSPDAAWVKRERLASLSREQRRKFIPLCPDFVIEIRSPTDSLSTLQEKMQEYLGNGAQLGWLIDPEQRRVYVYRPQVPAEVLERPHSLAATPLLPSFVLDLHEAWNDND